MLTACCKVLFTIIIIIENHPPFRKYVMGTAATRQCTAELRYLFISREIIMPNDFIIPFTHEFSYSKIALDSTHNDS